VNRIYPVFPSEFNKYMILYLWVAVSQFSFTFLHHFYFNSMHDRSTSLLNSYIILFFAIKYTQFCVYISQFYWILYLFFISLTSCYYIYICFISFLCISFILFFLSLVSVLLHFMHDRSVFPSKTHNTSDFTNRYIYSLCKTFLYFSF
jgi:hypothetical protein